MTVTEPPKPDVPLRCSQCGMTLELPADLTEFLIHCPGCGADNVLPAPWIQARQRQHDMQFLAVERARQLEQQRLMQQRMLQARQAASRRTTIAVWVLISIFLILPGLALGSLLLFGIHFGTRAFESMKDQRKNGLGPISSEIQQKLSQGCQRVVHAPEIRLGGAGQFHMPLKADGPCIHLMGATSVAGAELTLEQLSQYTLPLTLPKPAALFDYRLCPTVDGSYDFSVRSNQSGPYSIAAVACPRTVAEGLVRSMVDDPVTTGVVVIRGWADGLRTKGCQISPAGITAVQGHQVIEIESVKGGACFQLAVASHFADAPLSVRLWSPTGKSIAEPAPATRVQLEYCPNDTGKHRIEVVPSTRDHFAIASFDCPRRK